MPQDVFITLHQRSGCQQRGYFDAQEHNRIAQLYFQFTVGHTVLWDMINSSGMPEASFEGRETETKSDVHPGTRMKLVFAAQ